MGHVVFCCDDATACFLIETMNDARPFLSADA
jgi:hypothetical protein